MLENWIQVPYHFFNTYYNFHFELWYFSFVVALNLHQFCSYRLQTYSIRVFIKFGGRKCWFWTLKTSSCENKEMKRRPTSLESSFFCIVSIQLCLETHSYLYTVTSTWVLALYWDLKLMMWFSCPTILIFIEKNFFKILCVREPMQKVQRWLKSPLCIVLDTECSLTMHSVGLKSVFKLFPILFFRVITFSSLHKMVN